MKYLGPYLSVTTRNNAEHINCNQEKQRAVPEDTGSLRIANKPKRMTARAAPIEKLRFHSRPTQEIRAAAQTCKRRSHNSHT